MKHQPLVSIIIITYNSSEYVLETLDSAIEQTYQNKEIIITDDCSTDNTLEVCRKWIREHEKDGVYIKLIEAQKNTGTTGNHQRGVDSAHGEWIKCIAGDDILAPTAVEAYVDYINIHPDVRHLRACAVHFTGDFKDADLSKHDKISQFMYHDGVTAKDQFKVITKTFFGSGPTYFYKREALYEIGGYDERFPMQEDYPMFIKMIGKGYKMEYMDKVTVYKRIVPTSIQYDTAEGAIFPKNKVRMIREWRYEYKMEQLGPTWRMFLRYSLWLQNAIIKAGNTYHSPKCRFLNVIDKITDPFVWCDRWLARKNRQYSACPKK